MLLLPTVMNLITKVPLGELFISSRANSAPVFISYAEKNHRVSLQCIRSAMRSIGNVGVGAHAVGDAQVFAQVFEAVDPSY